MFDIEEYRAPADIKAVDSLVAAYDEKKQAYIRKREEIISAEYNRTTKGALAVAKAMFEVKALFDADDDGEDTNFGIWAHGRFQMSKSVAYAAVATYKAWKDYDLNKCTALLTPSVLGVLVSDRHEDIRKIVYDACCNGDHISKRMAQNAVRLFNAGVELKKITPHAMRFPAKLLDHGSEENNASGEDEDEKSLTFKHGQNVEIKIIYHCETRPEDSEIIDALNDAIQKIVHGDN